LSDPISSFVAEMVKCQFFSNQYWHSCYNWFYQRNPYL